MVELTPEQAVQRAKFEEAQLQSLQQQANSIYQMLAEIKVTKQLIQNLPEQGNTMFPAGSGVFVEGQVSGTKTLMDIGAGNVVEKSPKEIIKALEEREKELEEALKKVSGDAQAIGGDLEVLRTKISDYVRKQQSEPSVPVIG